MSDKRKLFKSLFFGIITALLIGIILMCIAAAAFISIGLPQGEITEYVMLAVSLLGSMAGGFVCAKLNKGAGLIVGLMTGAAVFVILSAIGMIKGGDFSALSAIRLAASLAGGAIGGVLGLKECKKLKI